MAGLLASGCGRPLHSTEPFARFDTPRFSGAAWSPTREGGEVHLALVPGESFRYVEGLDIREFRSPSGHKGRVFIHFPKGVLELRFIAWGVHGATSDMVYEWQVCQHGRPVQDMQVRVVPGDPVKVFLDGHEIAVHTDGMPASAPSGA